MKILKPFVTGLAIVLALLAPACRSSRKPQQPRTTTTATTDTAPSVPMVEPTTTRAAETTVTQEPDFVQERPVEEPLPRDIEALNRFVQERGLVRDAFFEYDAVTLSPDAQDALTTSATWLRNNAGYSLLVEGHCDERGTEQYNLALGDRRANTVKDFLMSLGVDGSRIRTVSYGEERPFDEGHDESAWRQNRRAHLVLVR